MRSKLSDTDHTYVHSYGDVLPFHMFLNPQILNKLDHDVEMKRFGVEYVKKKMFEVETC